MAKIKTAFIGAEMDLIKVELDKALDAVYYTNFFELDDEIAYRTNMAGLRQPYIISSIEDKLNSVIVVLEDSTEQLKAIRNVDGLTDFVEIRSAMIQKKVKDLQEFYRNKTYAEITHRFKEYTFTNSKGKLISIELEASTKEQQTRVRSTIQKKILKVLTNIELILAEAEKKRLINGAEVPERMTFKTESRK